MRPKISKRKQILHPYLFLMLGTIGSSVFLFFIMVDLLTTEVVSTQSIVIPDTQTFEQKIEEFISDPIAVEPDVIQGDQLNVQKLEQNHSELSIRLKIPSIGVDAGVEEVSLAADGSMDVPKYPENAAWYQLGTRPGQEGSAVIAGHVDWMNGAPAVFANLDKLKPGDKIEVQDGEGDVVFFTVREIRVYDALADATEVFTSRDGKAHLNLITCSGAWDKKTKQYAERLVVFADKEE